MPRRNNILKPPVYDLRNGLNIVQGSTKKTYNKQAFLNTWFTMTDDLSSSGNAFDVIRNAELEIVKNRPGYSTSILPERLAGVSTVSLDSAYRFLPSPYQTVLAQPSLAPTGLFNFGSLPPGDANAFTMSFWVYFAVTTVDQNLIAKWNDGLPAEQQYKISFNQGSKSIKFEVNISGNIYSAQSAAGAVPDDSKWYHVSIAFSGNALLSNHLTFYVNGDFKGWGNLRKSGTPYPIGSLPVTSAKFSIGNDFNDGSANRFLGRIADFAIWTTALEQEDIFTLYSYLNSEQYSLKSGFVNLPPRIEIRNRDNATGSYPTILRMGDKDRRGSYSTQFDDTNTILFGRRIRDNFELKEEDKESGILGYTKKINTRDWTQSGDLEIRRELISSSGGSTAKDGALVLAGAGDGSGHRWIQTKEKIKNPVLEAEVIFGPYNEQRTVLKHGLGLKSPGSTEDRGLKIQVSTSGLPGTWTTIKTLTGDVESLFVLSSFSSRSAFEALLQKRKRTKIKLTPSDFSGVAGSEFYLRFAQESVSDPNQVEWAIGYVNIDYHKEDVRYPLMIDPASRVGQRIATGAIATPHELPTLTAPGRSISGISDVHLKFTPGEGISAFDDSRINIVPENFFFQQGSDPEDVEGLSSPLWSKTQFVVDLSPNEETTFGMTSKSTYSSPFFEQDDTVKQQLMVYWNNDLKRWEKIAQGISANAPGIITANLKNMISSGALGFSNCDLVATGASNSIADLSIHSSNVLNSYARPTSVFGFPFEGKYHATSSQLIKASDLGITKPFILEKCQISFDSKFEFAKTGDDGLNAFTLKYAYAATRTSAAAQLVIIPTFFMLRQQDYDNFSKTIDYKVDVTSYSDRQRSILIPDASFRLSADNEKVSYVESSRETITYGQMTMFTSSSAVVNNLNLREVLDKGLTRDTEVDILKLTNQSNTYSPGGGSPVDLNALTSSFQINFPSRLTGKIDGGARFIVKEGVNKSGLWLNNSLGGRSYANLDTFARAVTAGTPGLKFGENFTNQSSDSTTTNLVEVSVSAADSTDVYSPYIIMPEDKIIFGWQYPLPFSPYSNSPGNSDANLNSMTLFGNSKLTLFGSQLKDNIEFHETNNQNLVSDGIHEMIGSEPVVDQFELSRAIENFGNYLDNYVNITTEEPTARILAAVQSRLTTPKGQSGASQGSITIGQFNYTFVKPGGVNDGDLIVLQDHLGNYGFFFFFDRRPHGTETGGFDSAGSATPGTLANTESWGLLDYVSLEGYSLDYDNNTTAIDWHAVFDTIDTNINTYLNAAYGGWTGVTTALPPNSFSVNTWLEASSYTYAKNTLDRLRLAINASSLDIIPDSVTDIFSGPPGVGDVYSWYARLNLTQGGNGIIGDTAIYVKPSNTIDGTSNTYDGFARQNFSGGKELLDSTLGSFVRISPTRDGTRVYADSLLSGSIIDTPLGGQYSNFGTMQTGGSEIRPKYYLDSRKYGQSAHFLEQGKDSKSDFDLKTRRSGLLNTLKGESLGAPVRVEFVSGSTSDSTATRRFRRSSASQTTAVNKSINSVLTGAFFEM